MLEQSWGTGELIDQLAVTRQAFGLLLCCFEGQLAGYMSLCPAPGAVSFWLYRAFQDQHRH